MAPKCYVDSVPPEILALIFKLCMKGTIINGKRQNRNTHALLEVCRKWKEVALQSGCLKTITANISSPTRGVFTSKGGKVLHRALQQFNERCMLVRNGLVD